METKRGGRCRRFGGFCLEWGRCFVGNYSINLTLLYLSYPPPPFHTQLFHNRDTVTGHFGHINTVWSFILSHSYFNNKDIHPYFLQACNQSFEDLPVGNGGQGKTLKTSTAPFIFSYCSSTKMHLCSPLPTSRQLNVWGWS